MHLADVSLGLTIKSLALPPTSNNSQSAPSSKNPDPPSPRPHPGDFYPFHAHQSNGLILCCTRGSFQSTIFIQYTQEHHVLVPVGQFLLMA